MASKEEKRNDNRKPFTVTFEFTYSSMDKESLRCTNGLGISLNISEKGIGFLTNQAFSQGQDITLYNRSISEKPVKAEVRWCSKLSGSLYKVGLCFN